MEKLKMHTPDLANENYKKLADLFPNAVTETITGYDADGNPIVERAIDADALRQEIAAQVVEGAQERYQFTWPDKKKSVVLANQPIAKTLRLVREKSVGRDGTPGSIDTENIYIEGDNLDALKLLQETYLGKVKMIYIDPPYNTGSDAFVYDDDFASTSDEFSESSGQRDEDGNLLFDMRVNNESNGRFHTDWLNMIYPRLRIAKDILSEDGIILISIDEHEYANLKKICDEVFGIQNYFGDIVWESTTQPINAGSAKFGLQKKTESILMYGKNKSTVSGFLLHQKESELDYPHQGKFGSCRFEIIEKSDSGAYNRPSMKFQILGQYPRKGKRWQIGEDTARQLEREGKVEIVDGIVKKAVYPEDEADKVQYKPFWSLFGAGEYGTAQTGKDELNSIMGKPIGFDTVKSIQLMKELLFHLGKEYTVLDFFSGSATTAHAMLKLNAEDGGNRKFVLVQIPEETGEDSDAYSAGYKNICELGEERIRRAGKKIRKESPQTTANLDTGFRVFRVDSSNMKDVYYRPNDIERGQLSLLADNIKEDRQPEDLLFQVMLDLGVMLSSKIEETTIDGKKVFSVADGYLIACFDKNVTDETVKAIAKKQPFYAVFRDAGFASDSVMTNFEQIFETYSPKTQRKVL